MREPETMSAAIEKLNQKGYIENFRAEKGMLRALAADRLFDPANLKVDETVRFEGETDLDDEAVIFALSDEKSGIKGTYTTAYSTDMDPADMDIVRKLRPTHRRH